MQELLESAHAELLALFPGRRVSINIRIGNYIPGNPCDITMYAMLTSEVADDCKEIAAGRSIAELMRAAKKYATRGN